MTRQERRAAERLARKHRAAAERKNLIRQAAALIDDDASVSGCTIIMPSGTIDYIDAKTLRRGGGRA